MIGCTAGAIRVPVLPLILLRYGPGAHLTGNALNMTVSLIDIGANLTHDSFDKDRNRVISRAIDAGVDRFILTGSSAEGSQDAVSLVKEYPQRLFATAGVHPHHASEYSDDVHRILSDLTRQKSVVAVGECGLDYYRNFSPVQQQKNAFSRQLDLAEHCRKPLFLHQRDAHDDFVSLLRPRIDSLPQAVAHCFTGDEAMLSDYLEMGLFVGITGWICDERRGSHLRALIPRIPANRLMIETDAPYLLPRTLTPRPKTRRNEPAYLGEVLRVVAESAGRSVQDVARETTANAERFFNLSATDFRSGSGAASS